MVIVPLRSSPVKEESCIHFSVWNQLQANKNSASIQTNLQIGNYGYYSLAEKDQFYVITRIEDTFIYVNAPKANMDEVKDIITSLGY